MTKILHRALTNDEIDILNYSTTKEHSLYVTTKYVEKYKRENKDNIFQKGILSRIELKNKVYDGRLLIVIQQIVMLYELRDVQIEVMEELKDEVRNLYDYFEYIGYGGFISDACRYLSGFKDLSNLKKEHPLMQEVVNLLKTYLEK